MPGLIAALAGLGAGLVYAARHYRAEPDLWYWFWLVAGTLALAFTVSLLVRPLYVDRYFVVILPALIVLMLRGWRTSCYGFWTWPVMGTNRTGMTSRRSSCPLASFVIRIRY